MSFPPLKNDLILRAARGEQPSRSGAGMCLKCDDFKARRPNALQYGSCGRRAGTFLVSPSSFHPAGIHQPFAPWRSTEFRAVRAEHGFFEICRTAELAKEITLQPIRRYTGLIDAAIIFSDILVVPQALGMEVQMNPGPHFPDPLATPADIEKLTKNVDVDKELGYVYEAITQTRHALNGEVPLIGFCGAPWTLFSYMIEGGGTKTFQKCKSWLFLYPEESKALLNRIADVCIDFLVGQIKAGAQVRASNRTYELAAFDAHAIHASVSWCRSSTHGQVNSPLITSRSFLSPLSSVSPPACAKSSQPQISPQYR